MNIKKHNFYLFVKSTISLRSIRLLLPVCILMLTAPLEAIAEVCAPPASGLVSWWPGEGNGDDIIGSNSGTVGAGTTFATGTVGQAFQFDGSSEVVQVPDSPSLQFGSGDVTVEAWIKAPQGITDRGIVGKYTPNPWNSIMFRLNGGGILEFAVTDCGTAGCGWGTTRQPVSSLLRVDDDLFHHVAGVRHSTGYELYVDGILVATRDEAARDVGITQDLLIGALLSGVQPYIGIIDEVKIYNQALTANDIQSIFNAGSSGSCNGVPTPNNPPFAFAGTSVDTGILFLDASASFDLDGDALSFGWEVFDEFANSALSVTIGSGNSKIDISSLASGNYKVVLTVSDTNAQDTDTMLLGVP